MIVNNQEMLTWWRNKMKMTIKKFEKNIDNFIDLVHNKNVNDYDHIIETCINNPMKTM